MRAPWIVFLGAACVSLVFGCQSRPAGDLSEAQLSKVVDERRPTLESCYNAALEKTAYTNEVRMAAIIHVAPDGSVQSVEVEGTGLPGMPACVDAAIKTWRFPTATDATHTRLPIVFSPQVVQRPAPPSTP